MTAPVVIGTDPGGAFTGVCARQGDRCGEHALIERYGDMWVYAGEVANDVLEMVGQYRHEAGLRVVVAVEDLNLPNPHMGLTNLRGYSDTAWLIGYLHCALEGAGAQLVMVPPGGHGSAPLATYPPQLVGARETQGAGRLRHVRSAYDIAGAARTILRTEAA